MKVTIDMVGTKEAEGTDMAGTPQNAPRDKGQSSPGIGRRLMWFGLLWLGGVASVGAVSLLLRTWIGN